MKIYTSFVIYVQKVTSIPPAGGVSLEISYLWEGWPMYKERLAGQ